MIGTLTQFGKLCFDARIRLTMTRPELAKMVGTSPKDISDIETGKKPEPAHYVALVTGILGLDTFDVELALSGTDSQYKLTRIAQPKYGA
jgi:transcriptional regulator with XRE-family HTH domain